MSEQLLRLLADASFQTLYMVAASGLIGTALGLPLGVLLATTGKGELLESPNFNRVAGAIVNATRSTPFIILVVAIIPFTRLVAGTSIGTTAAIVPLTVAAIPFIARIVEGAVREVDQGLIEAAEAMGARPLQVIGKILLFPIEFISFAVRPFSLGLRPFIATFAGHILLDIFGNFVVQGFNAGGGGIAISILCFLFVAFISALELLVAAIQAYVFAILTALYINDAVNLH